MYKTIAKIAHHIMHVQKMVMCVSDELRKRAFDHDASKFSKPELEGYQRFEDMPEGLEYGSKEYKAEMAKVMENNKCFEVHAAHNDHHPEHWDYPEGGTDIGLMPLFPIIEMVCDWAGAHLSYGNKGDWKQSVQHNIKRFNFSTSQVWVIENVADFLEKKNPELWSDIDGQ